MTAMTDHLDKLLTRAASLDECAAEIVKPESGNGVLIHPGDLDPPTAKSIARQLRECAQRHREQSLKDLKEHIVPAPEPITPG